ncbi:sel1 repeat family protein [Geomonas terrae]|uniref:Sel1 repeat family protein n=1 Tax=Geomonas terrae TaxID=2562681 RepID=A0A4S1CCS8_9BACT|nr:tetratricopeptide repeat protein [Geomonas terrae]TGU71215.1 sel1 repeat family protein [Geomonas terrae]
MKVIRVFCWLFLSVLFGAVYCHGFDGTDFKGIKKLAEKGDAEAQMKVGVMLSAGVGVEQDLLEGLKWYQKSADQGYPEGEWNLAFVYIRGEIVPQDFKKAFGLMQKAADAGLADAQYDLGMMYLQGLALPAPDQGKAEVWFRRASTQGHRDAKRVLKELAAVSTAEQQKQ